MFSIMDQLFPEATDVEVNETKYYLDEYKRFKKVVNELGRENELSAEQQQKYIAAKKFTDLFERVVRLIPEDDVRKMVEKRYIKGDSFTIVVAHFSSIMHPDTVNEKLKKGIKTVANTLKDIS